MRVWLLAFIIVLGYANAVAAEDKMPAQILIQNVNLFDGKSDKLAEGSGALVYAGASGERRPGIHRGPGEPIRPIEGRVVLRRGGVALLCRWRPHRHVPELRVS
jgi:hypothetical protein